MCMELNNYHNYIIQSQKLAKGSKPVIHKYIVATKASAIKLEEELNTLNTNKNFLFKIKRNRRN